MKKVIKAFWQKQILIAYSTSYNEPLAVLVHAFGGTIEERAYALGGVMASVNYRHLDKSEPKQYAGCTVCKLRFGKPESLQEFKEDLKGVSF